MAMMLPGTFGVVFCSENIQAAKIAKQGFRNSDGCSDKGPTEIQRVASGRILIGVPYKQDIRMGQTTCQACAANDDCPAGAPNCRYGYCEVN